MEALALAQVEKRTLPPRLQLTLVQVVEVLVVEVLERAEFRQATEVSHQVMEEEVKVMDMVLGGLAEILLELVRVQLPMHMQKRMLVLVEEVVVFRVEVEVEVDLGEEGVVLVEVGLEHRLQHR